MRLSLPADEGPDDVDDGDVDVVPDLDRLTAAVVVDALLLQDFDQILNFVLNKSFQLRSTESEFLELCVSKLPPNLPFFPIQAGEPVVAVTEELEHEGVRPVKELIVGESLLDCVVGVQDHSKLCADSKAEDVSVLSPDVSKGLAKVVDVKEG